MCFAVSDSSTIILVADAPLVPRSGSGSGSGEPFRLTLTANLATGQVHTAAAEHHAPVWQKIDTGAFSILAPIGWQFRQLPGVDSYVGEFVGDGMTLTFDFGDYSSGHYLDQARKPAYVIARKSIGGFSARVVSPRVPGKGITGVYFQDVGGSNKLCVFGKDLTAAQQEVALRVFDTIQFRPPEDVHILNIVPPPPPPEENPH